MKAMVGSIGSGTLVVRACVAGLAWLTLACGGDEPKPGASTSGSRAGSSSGAATSTAKPAKVVDPATVGSIAGVVRAQGTVPKPQFIKMVGESYCMGLNPDGGYLDDRLVVDDGKLSNAFVWISDGLEGYEFEPPDRTVHVDQKGCLFRPRILGVQLGQQIEAANSDGVMHNVHTRPEFNRPQNFGMPPGLGPRELRFKREEVMVEVVCDVHAWMKAWIGVVDHPFFAVTGSDGGFHLAGVPPGDYTLGVWHEQLGKLAVDVTVGASQQATAGEIAYQL